MTGVDEGCGVRNKKVSRKAGLFFFQNRTLQMEYDHLKLVRNEPSLPGSPSYATDNIDANKDAEMIAEARLLRQHKGRLEARMQILEEHNRQLESQLQRLRQLLAQV